MKSLVDQYQDRYFDPRTRMSGDALGIGIDGIKDLLYRPQIDKGELMDLLYRKQPRQLTPGEVDAFFRGMDPGDLFGGK